MENQHPPYESVLNDLDNAIRKIESLNQEVADLKEQIAIKDNYILELQKTQ